ncbi:MAG: ABC transporter ATP-binding protein [Oscillospiraceae bacterium]|jgi:oligopeptide transport system ATP-binding protein|nr:ABC transporter ATP-binding protein [Oscillospiraceae bacterium]
MSYDNVPLLSVRDLVVKFTLRGQTLTAIRGASLSLFSGESLAIVGESGSGKSVLVKSLMGMLDKNGYIANGSIQYEGRELTEFKTEREWLAIRGREIAMVMQDPMTSLNPLKTIGSQIGEAIALHQNLRGTAKRDAIHSLIADVGIPDPLRRAKQYPHEFSGGMRQRVVIAVAMACKPKILICDEPTTALDVTIQAQILELIKTLQRIYSLTVIYITHDLGVVARVADRVAVMYAGDVIEQGTTEEVFFTPAHPYTWALLSSLPQLGRKGEPLYAIEGTPPSLFDTIKGDAFAPRNTRALRIDALYAPPSFRITATHSAKTWLLDPMAPRIDAPEAIRRLRG